MQNEFFEKMTEASKSSYTAMQELGDINSKLVKSLSELQLGFATYSVESGVEFFKTLSSTTNYKDFISAETEYVTEYGTKVMELSNKTAEILNESRDEVVGLFEKNVEKVASEKTTTTKRASKKAA